VPFFLFHHRHDESACDAALALRPPFLDHRTRGIPVRRVQIP
jgi:hypothetical protein